MTKYSTILGVFWQPWVSSCPAILKADKVLVDVVDVNISNEVNNSGPRDILFSSFGLKCTISFTSCNFKLNRKVSLRYGNQC